MTPLVVKPHIMALLLWGLPLIASTPTCTGSDVCSDSGLSTARGVDAAELDDSTSLLQVFQQVDEKEQPHSKGGSPASRMSMMEQGVDFESLLDETTSCVYYEPLDLMRGYSFWRLFGYAEPRKVCKAHNHLVPGMLKGHKLGLVEVSDSLGMDPNIIPVLVPITFVGILLLIILNMMISITLSKPPEKDPVPGKVRRPEAESWKRGIFAWLYCDFVTEWVCRWGNISGAEATRIHASDLGKLGDAEDECEQCYQRIERIWEAEVAEAGVERASLIKVLLRYITWQRIAVLGIWTGLYEAFMYIGPPAAMSLLISNVEDIYLKRADGYAFDSYELLPATVLAIVLFAGMPLACSIANTLTALLAMRMSVRMCGGLSCLIYRKAQRLPTSSQIEASQDEAASLEAEKKLDGVVKREQAGAAASKKHINTADEPNIKDNNEIPQKFSLVQVVAKDANSMLVWFPVALMKMIITIPIICILFFLLFLKIGFTMFLCIALSGFMFWRMTKQGEGAAVECYGFLYWSDKRLRYMEEVFFNIRTIKACGWEHVSEEKVSEIRSIEVERLSAWFWNFAWLCGYLISFPKVMITTALWGYMLLNNKSQVLGIWTILPLLFTFQTAFLSTMQSLPIIINAFPSFLRLQAYMKLHEAPNGTPRNEEVPAHMEVWQKPKEEGMQIPISLPNPNCCVRVQGSFSWMRQGDPFLKDIDLIVPSGSSLAIIGKVGSGKTSLLMALLGELYPIGDARISIPTTVAYSNQVPYIMEGTLQTNVLSAQSFDAERYSQAIYASCLSPDLEILPGGDMVPIGSRGIVLSGGQKARVSMARAAYSDSTLKVLDDPFSALDARTSRHVLDNYIFGDFLKNSTRIVVSQPDKRNISRYDKVILLSEGKIACQGTPDEVIRTEEYRRLLNKEQAESLEKEETENQQMEKLEVKTMSQIRPADDAFKLREEEFQGRATWGDVWWLLGRGGFFNFGVLISGYLVCTVFNLLCGIVLQRWSTEQMDYESGTTDTISSGFSHLPAWLFWYSMQMGVFFLAYHHGIKFTCGKSSNVHSDLVYRLLHAPIDRFFDKTPVGRIMNRFTADNMQMDTEFMNEFVQVFVILFTDFIPILYIHVLMPIYFSLATIPVYIALFIVLKRYFNTMIPLRYLAQTSKSKTNEALIEVDGGITYVRAAQISDSKFFEFMERMDDQLRATVGTETFVKRWVIVRIFLLVSFYTTTMVLLAIWVPDLMEYGALGFCLSNLLLVSMSVESDIESATKAQYQFIYMNRLHEYSKIGQEKPAIVDGDQRYTNFAATIKQQALGDLEMTYDSQTSALKIGRKTRQGQLDLVLVQKPDSNVFVAPRGKRLSDLDPSNATLAQAENWHQISSVNGVWKDAKKMAEEFCTCRQDEHGKILDKKILVESGWLAEGARVSIEGLCAGYGDIPRMVLKDVTLEVAPCSNVGFVGATGCGKSTLLLCMLRIIERRGGCISINNIDIADIGLQTLRTTVGLVPQDPVIMNATVRNNIDPFQWYDDSQLWPALRMVGLEETVKNMKGELNYQLAGEAADLSFGQRQLFCLARLIVRQPPLILLDEATSALDPKTQEIVQKAVETEFPASTLMVIAHRLETIMGFDKIVVMDKGRIAEQGSVKDLKDVKGGLFAKMLAAKQTW